MPPTVRPVPSFNPSFSPGATFSREAGTPPLPRPAIGPGGASRAGALSERDLMADLEPHWAAAIDAATD
jgi:hypothetical protein